MLVSTLSGPVVILRVKLNCMESVAKTNFGLLESVIVLFGGGGGEGGGGVPLRRTSSKSQGIPIRISFISCGRPRVLS